MAVLCVRAMLARCVFPRVAELDATHSVLTILLLLMLSCRLIIVSRLERSHRAASSRFYRTLKGQFCERKRTHEDQTFDEQATSF
jgi:hypothetical protein